MSRASKAKQRRRAESGAQARATPGRSRRTLWLAIGAGAALVAVIVVVVVLASGSSSGSKGPSDQLAADRNASAQLSGEADAVGFHETTDPGSGTIEGKPSSAALPPHSTLL